MKLIRAVILVTCFVFSFSFCSFANGEAHASDVQSADAPVISDEVASEFVKEVDKPPVISDEVASEFVKEVNNQQTAETDAVSNTNTQYVAYSLPEDQIEWIAKMAVCENGYTENAVRYEVSLICNITDEGDHGSTPFAVVNSGWFAQTTKVNARSANVPQNIINIVRDVLAGNRISNCDEHDCFKDIRSVETNGVVYTNPADIANRANYVSGITVITNKSGSRYVFECFPAANTDPFGEIV